MAFACLEIMPASRAHPTPIVFAVVPELWAPRAVACFKPSSEQVKVVKIPLLDLLTIP